ncbi:MAG: thioredoxin family protein, partial [Rhodospirillales bacterium]|nr:thioredoxin family protein [Rhodospirillales bacterium]
GGESRIVRLSFLSSAAGILFSFLVLATALIVLKLSGAVIGWGIQFQQPMFLVAMTLVVSLFAYNLWGFFEIRLPQRVGDLGERTSHVHGLGGHFLSGAFATLLATPCSAPFLGTAVGFALARGVGEIYAVFAALGLGLAIPYLLVAFRPNLATRLPKPGSWMIVLRRILGFALAATGVWLLSVLEVQAGRPATVLVGLLILGVGLILYLHHRRWYPLGRSAGWTAAAVALAAFAVPGGLVPLPPPPVTVKGDPIKGLWVPFDQTAISGLVAQGKTVFVDVTADWCITCQVNKAIAFSEDKVLSRFKSGEVITMQADWTRPSDEIARYLAGFGRYGIPFNVVYGPGAPEGLVLPELLSPGAVLAGIKKAQGDGKAVSKR